MSKTPLPRKGPEPPTRALSGRKSPCVNMPPVPHLRADLMPHPLARRGRSRRPWGRLIRTRDTDFSAQVTGKISSVVGSFPQRHRCDERNGWLFQQLLALISTSNPFGSGQLEDGLTACTGAGTRK